MFAFFSLAFAISWICWMAAFGVQRLAAGAASSALATLLFYVGTFAPAIVALIFTSRNGEHGGSAALVDRIFRTNLPVRWYLFAIGWFPLAKLAAVLVHRFAKGAWPPFGSTEWYVVLGALAVSTPVQAGEEIGWRGYALPRLALRLGVGPASVLLGAIWALWHLPLFMIPGVDNYGQSFTMFLVAVTALSVAMAWLYLRTGGSLLLVMLMHAAVDQTPFILPSNNPTTANPFAVTASLVGGMTAAFLVCGAVFLLIRMRRTAAADLEALLDGPAHQAALIA